MWFVFGYQVSRYSLNLNKEQLEAGAKKYNSDDKGKQFLKL